MQPIIETKPIRTHAVCPHMSRVRRPTIVPLLFGAACLLAVAAPAGAAGNKARGGFYARENCSTCHAVGPAGISPYPLAPPFRTLHEKYDVAGLAEALAEGIAVGNTGVRQMPMFVLSGNEIEDLIAYLKSLEPVARPSGRDGRAGGCHASSDAPVLSVMCGRSFRTTLNKELWTSIVPL
jgi:cytochrome c